MIGTNITCAVCGFFVAAGIATSMDDQTIPGLTLIERYGVLGLLAWMIWWQANRNVKAQDTTSAAVAESSKQVRELAIKVEQFVAVTSQAHRDYAESRDRAVDAVRNEVKQGGAVLVQKLTEIEERITKAISGEK